MNMNSLARFRLCKWLFTFICQGLNGDYDLGDWGWTAKRGLVTCEQIVAQGDTQWVAVALKLPHMQYLDSL